MDRGMRAAGLLAAVIVAALVCLAVAQRYRTAGDVVLYQRYAQQLRATPPRLPQEYPPLTAAIFAIPELLVPRWYLAGFAALAGWALWITLLLVDDVGRRGPWLALYAALAGAGTLVVRFDAVVVLATVTAWFLARRGRWGWAQALLALGFALKLYPALLMPVVSLWAWQHSRRQAVWSSALGAGLVAGAVGLMWLLAPAQLQTMLQYHAARPLQTELLGASLAWLTGPAGSVWSFGSANITAPLAPLIARGMSLATVLVVGLAYVLFWRRRIGPAAACALVLLGAIGTSKVFSTQYVLWALPFVVLAGERRWLWLLLCAATALVYPLAFHSFEPQIGAATLPWQFGLAVATRNGLWLVAWGVGLWDWQRPAPAQTHARRRAEPPAQVRVEAKG